MNIRNRDRLEKKDDRKAFEGKDNCENICATTERRRDERRRRPSPFGASARKKCPPGCPGLAAGSLERRRGPGHCVLQLKLGSGRAQSHQNQGTCRNISMPLDSKNVLGTLVSQGRNQCKS